MALGRDPSHKSTLLRARCLLRLGDADAAVNTLRTIGAIRRSSASRREYHTVFATALSRTVQPEAQQHYAAAARISLRVTGAMQLELMFYRALDSWRLRDLTTARRITAKRCS